MLQPDVYDIILLAAGILVLMSALLPRTLEKHLAEFQGAREVVALVTLIIIFSVLMHGLSARPAMKWVEARND